MELKSDFIQNVVEVVNKYDLKRKCRKHEVLYPRYYIYSLLRNANYSLSAIGRIFDKDHASVLHGIRMHQNFSELNDKLYIELTERVREEIVVQPQSVDLKQEILKCNTIKQLNVIKYQILNNFY